MKEATRPIPDPDGAARERELERVLDRWEAPLLRYATRIVRSPETAEDIVQEVFIRYLRTPPDGTDERLLSTWLYRVTHNLCVDWIRKESRVRDRSADIPRRPPAPTPSDELAEKEARAELDRLMGELTENQRTVLALKMQEGLSYREISEVTGLTVTNVGFIIHTAMKRVTGMIESGRAREGRV